MAYTKQTWADLPSKTTPINANRLTHIEDGIFNAAQTADTAASTAGTAAANVGIVAGRVETLTDRVNGLDTAVSNKVDKVAGKGLSTNDYDDTDKGKVDSLGTASTKNSTSVVTQSTDLVESGAVYDALGFGNKNKLQVRKELTSTSLFTVNRNNYDEVTSIVGNGSVTADQTLWLIGNGWNYSNCEDVSKYFKAGQTYTLSDGTNNDANQFIQLNIRDSEGVILSARSDNLNEYHRTFTMPSDLTGLKIHCWLRVNNGQSMTNKVFYPQLEEGASITSFEPYHASVEQTMRDAEVIEGKNLWEFGNQTPSDYNSLKFSKVLPAGTYILSAKVTTTYSGNMVDARFRKENTSSLLVVTLPANTGKVESVEFTLNEPAYYVFVYASTGNDSYVCSWENIMLRKATETDPTYEPYYTPLKDVVPTKADNSVIGTVEDGTNPTKSYAVGEHMIRGGKFCTVTVAVTTSSTWTLGSNYVEGDVADSLIKESAFGGTTSSIGALIVSTSNTRHILSAEVMGCTATLYKRSEGYGAIINTPQGEPIVETAVSGRYYYVEY